MYGSFEKFSIRVHLNPFVNDHTHIYKQSNTCKQQIHVAAKEGVIINTSERLFLSYRIGAIFNALYFEKGIKIDNL